jgi:pimeloyl-ACP methyl ester carboxylesterase
VSPARPGLLGVGLGAGVLAAGATVGAVVERRILGRPLKDAQTLGTGFGSVHSPPVVVTASDGVELYAEVDEPPEDAALAGMTVVFCHGYALNLDCWHYQRLALAPLTRSVYWDQRGHGRSGRGEPGRVPIERLADDLLAVIDATARSGPVVLVGHSMGGMTLLALADRHPRMFGKRIVGTVLMSTSAGRLAEVTLGVPATVSRLLRRAAPGVVATLGRAPRLVALGRRTGTDLEFALTRMYSFASDVPPATVDFVARMNAAVPLDVLADLLPAFDSHDKIAALPVLRRTESMILVGDDDRLTPAQHSRDMAELLPTAELDVLPDSGHMVMLERPDEVNERLRGLLERVDVRLATRSGR